MGKRNKSRRLFPRKMASDFINTNQGIDKVKTGAYEALQYNKRALQGRVRTERVEKNNHTTYVPVNVEIPPTITQVTRQVWEKNPRTAVAKRIDQLKHREVDVWQGENRQQGFNEYLRGPLLSEWKGITVYLWFSGSNYKIIKTGPTFKATSCVYTDRDKAMSAWERDKVVWLDVICFTG